MKTKKVLINYISPSSIPSRSANAVHVVHMCEAFSELGARVNLFSKRTIRENSALRSLIKDQFDVKFKRVKLINFFSKYDFANNIKIALLALISHRLLSKKSIIISRNLYASFILAVLFNRQIYFETHQLEYGIRKKIQKMIVRKKRVSTIVISGKLRELLSLHTATSLDHNVLVLHDGAPLGIKTIPANQRKNFLRPLGIDKNLADNTTVCGYFGQLYEGRGIEILIELVKKKPEIILCVFGGNEEDIAKRREMTPEKNILFLGHHDHSKIIIYMASMDVLLMPYQKKVSIDSKGQDTGRWMSPIKMFEYMAVGVPIISSDLPVLREVLKDRHNCLLVSPSKMKEWETAIELLDNDEKLGIEISTNARNDYLDTYNWSERANSILRFFNQ